MARSTEGQPLGLGRDDDECPQIDSALGVLVRKGVLALSVAVLLLGGAGCSRPNCLEICAEVASARMLSEQAKAAVEAVREAENARLVGTQSQGSETSFYAKYLGAAWASPPVDAAQYAALWDRRLDAWGLYKQDLATRHVLTSKRYLEALGRERAALLDGYCGN